MFAAAIFGSPDLTLQNTIFDGNTAQNPGAPMQCQVGTITGSGDMQWPINHMNGGSADALCAPGIYEATDPMLGALGNHGGPVPVALVASGQRGARSGHRLSTDGRAGHAAEPVELHGGGGGGVGLATSARPPETDAGAGQSFAVHRQRHAWTSTASSAAAAISKTPARWALTAARPTEQRRHDRESAECPPWRPCLPPHALERCPRGRFWRARRRGKRRRPRPGR